LPSQGSCLSLLQRLLKTKTTKNFITNKRTSEDAHHEDAHALNMHAEEAHSEGHGHGAFVPASDTEGRKAVVKETVEHHLADSYEFHIVGPIGFPLPVILFDNGLKVFSSAKFHHGESVAEVDGSYYVVHHSKIYKTDAEGTITYDEHHHPTNEKPLDFLNH
jgi:hypothetical protein